MISKCISTYKSFFSDKKAIKLTLAALLLLGLSLIVNFYAGSYASIRQSNPVTDIILSNIRAYDVDSLFIYGTFIAFLTLFIYCLKKPFQIPYIVKSIALFIIVRCAFIVLTHVGAYPTVADINIHMPLYQLFSLFSFSGDLFFS